MVIMDVLLYPRAYHTCTKVGKKMYIFGGETAAKKGERFNFFLNFEFFFFKEPPF
jgi:hypothetical protein